MRIYELAKAIGQTFSVDVKSKDLADEFKTLPEFAPIHDTIKSHSSSVDEEYAAKMYDIYRQRFGKDRTEKPAQGKESGLSPVLKSPPAKSPEEKTQPPRPVRPVAPLPPRPTATTAPQARPLTPPRPSVPPRPAVQGGAGVPRPAPIVPPGAVRPVAPTPPPQVARPPQPVPAPPAPAEAAAPPAPAAPASEAAPAPARQPAPASPPQQQPPRQQVRPVAPQAPKPRPSGLASELKSSSGTTGFSATPETRRPEGRAGQPTAPPTPKFSADSPFLRPQRPPRKPEPKPAPARRPGEEAPAGTRSRGGDRDKGREAAPPMGELLTVPEIGVMKLKSPGKRRPAADKARPGRPGDKTAAQSEAEKARKKVRPSKVYGGADEFRRPLKAIKRGRPSAAERMRRGAEAQPRVRGPVVLTGPVTVGQFAEKLGLPAAEIIKASFLKGKPITINQMMEMELAEEIAIERDIDLQVRFEHDETDIEAFRMEDKPEDLVSRPPVVTIMGHVDHGKTTVLDYYRRSQVVEGEFGGITQHIGAYQVRTSRGEIVFLDTPGHQAFTSMRARGVQCTDIVVLVVGADDGVMPQTVESVNHARAAGVPIIVAVNKIDLPQARPERVQTELMQHGVVPSSLGGDVEFIEISAKQGTNMDALLEMILLQAEMLELKANPNRPAEAVVIESHVDALRGAVATVLVQRGTLRVGQYFVVGQQYGRVRAMLDDHGRPIEQSSLAQPIELIGLTGPPEVGELMLVMEDERKARSIAEKRQDRRRLVELGGGARSVVTLEGLHDMISEGKIKELNLILKADVQGSVEAINQSLDKLSTPAIRLRVLHSGTGSITESDVNLALASSAIIIGFNVRPEPGATDLAVRDKIDIRTYRIIYELLEDIERAMVGLLEKQYNELVQGRAEVREVFRVSRVGMVAGCRVVSGEVLRNAKARLVRDGKVVYDGKVDSLRRHKDDAAKVAAGYECGIMLERFQDVKQGDVIETYTLEEIPATLNRPQA